MRRWPKMPTMQYIQTIEDMELLYYNPDGQQFLSPDDLISPFIGKADAPVISTTSGVYNAIFGNQAWVQLNMEANTFGVLPKLPWTRSGWRVISARAGTLPQGGKSETAALPDSIKPTFIEVSTKPKITADVFENSEIQEFLATQTQGDDAYGAMVDLRTFFGVQHKEDLNVQLNTQNGALASNNFESVDRVVANNAEFANAKENDESTSYTANDLDIFSIDRDAAGWSDAYVNHNSATVQSLTDSIIQSVLQNTLKNGANDSGQFWQTGYDTWSTINQLYDTQVRYNLIGTTQIQAGVNGIQSLEGTKVGTRVSTLLNKTVILSKNTVVDTGGISRLYLLDPSNPEGFDYPRLFIKIAKPTQYFEAGMNQGTPFSIDKFGTQGMFRTMGELICTFFAAQGKARDLKA